MNETWTVRCMYINKANASLHICFNLERLHESGRENTGSRWIKWFFRFWAVCAETSFLKTENAVRSHLRSAVRILTRGLQLFSRLFFFFFFFISASLTWKKTFHKVSHRIRDSAIESNGCRSVPHHVFHLGCIHTPHSYFTTIRTAAVKTPCSLLLLCWL